MDMTDPDLTPQAGRGRRVIHNGQTVGTFTTPTLHQDEIWSAATTPPDGQAGPAQDETGQRRARPGRPGNDTGDAFDLQGTSKVIRSALRPGV